VRFSSFLRIPGSAFARSTVYNVAAQGSSQLTMLVITPLAVARLGPARFGIWSLVGVAVSVGLALDGGVGTAVSRFCAAAADGPAARKERDQTYATGLFAVLIIGTVLAVGTVLIAGTVPHLLHMPAGLRPEVATAVRSLGPLVLLSLVQSVTLSVLRAADRFGHLALVTVAGQAAFLIVAITVLLSAHPTVPRMLLALYAEVGSGAVLALLCAVRAGQRWQGLLPRAHARRFGGFAVRVQANSMMILLNWQSDAIVIAALLPVESVGYYSIGATAAAAVRNLPLWTLSPIFIRLSRLQSVGVGVVQAELARLQRLWVSAVTVYAAAAIGSVGFGVLAWVGRSYRQAAVVAVVLMLGYAVNIATGVLSSYARAIGRPDLELRYGMVAVSLNFVMTVAFVWLWGLYGVVTATAMALVIGSAYFVRLLQRMLGLTRDALLPRPPWLLGATIVLGVAAAETGLRPYLPTGFIGLGLAGMPPALAVIVGARVLRSAV
jgi:O-antigen/teichoic acid export membrane protein